MPGELLSEGWDDNCLPAVRAHLDDFGERPVSLSDIKLMILGNGRVGKTQIKNRLRGDPFEDDARSTHGITLSDAPIPGTSDRFNIWDFGGQDIYFGTHMLFLKSRAVFMLVWTPESDDSETHEHQGITFRNQPVAWWLDCICRFGSEKSPLIVVQNQLDRNRNRGEHPALAGVRNHLAHCSSIAYSARTDEGRGALDGHLKDAARRFNPPLIGRGRLEVMRALQQRLAEDAKRPDAEKQHRLLPFDDFVALCEKTGQVSDPRQFVMFLHNAGIVFWRDGLFQNQVILDQGWVLEAIYTIFHREHCLKTLRLRHGRFTRSELAGMIWDREGYTEDEQELFLSFMRSCGICFTLRTESEGFEAQYLAPDHLPETWDAGERLERWGVGKAEIERAIAYDSLPPALMRNLIGRIGTRAGLKGAYWRNGFYGFERETGAKILVEQALDERWQGRIRLEARGGRAERLISMIGEALREEEQKLGVTPKEDPGDPREHLPAQRDAAGRDWTEKPPAFAYEPRDKPSCFISYAWPDDKATEEGRARLKEIEHICARAKEWGVLVQRDKDVLRLGDSISQFMDRLAQGDLVIVILSDKYLRSSFCMYELCEIWREARGKKDDFLSRIRVYAYDDAKIKEPLGRAGYAKYWREKCAEIDAYIDKNHVHDFGDVDLQAHRYMRRLHMEIGNILTAVADTLHPGTIDDLIAYSFDDC